MPRAEYPVSTRLHELAFSSSLERVSLFQTELFEVLYWLFTWVEITSDDDDGMWFFCSKIEEPLLQGSEVLPFPVVTVCVYIECIHLELLVHHLHKHHLESFVKIFWYKVWLFSVSEIFVYPYSNSTTACGVLPCLVNVIVRRCRSDHLPSLLKKHDVWS